jgi:large subunit ribosomal protein L22
MEKTVKTKYIRMSPKKMRMFVDELKQKNANEVMDMLKLNFTKSAKIFAKVIKSGIALFEEKDKANVLIKNTLVNEGPVFKRWRAGSRGMAKKYVKRTSHIEMVFITKPEKEVSKKIENKASKLVSKKASKKEVKKTDNGK